MSRPVLRRIWGLIYRHIALYRTSWPRVLELAYWPTLQLCIWGFTARFLASRAGGIGATAFGLLVGGVLLWEIALRSQMGMTVSFLEEIWSRNLGHVFVSPLRPWELVAALIATSMVKLLIGFIPALLLAWLLYAFNLFSLGWPLALFAANLLVMGWWVSLGIISIILRHGAGAESFAWLVLFGLTPFSAVFYPVSVLPPAVRPVAFVLPSSHVFEGMRQVLSHGTVAWDQMGWATALNAIWLLAASALFMRQFHMARVRGALIAIGE